MTAHKVEYVELYVSDLKSSVDYFVAAFGFSAVAVSRTGPRNSVLLHQAGVQLVLTAGPATEDFLARHGDGVVDIAFACTDPAAVHDRAVAAGARSLHRPGGDSAPAVSGFGAVRHTLIAGRPGEQHLLPPGWEWSASLNGSGAKEVSRIKVLDHIAVCMELGTLQDIVRFYLDGFGFERYYSEYVEFGDQAMDSIVVRSPSAGITFTIIEPGANKTPGQIDEFLVRNGGAGVQHLAFLVDEIIPAVREFQDRGIEFLKTPAAYYEVLGERMQSMQEEIAELRETNVLADRDEWGYLLQLFCRSPYERRTLFYELIQRHGAQGFGSSNIRALYEAVERERAATS